MDDNPPITPENPEQVQEKGSEVAHAEAKQPTKRGRPAGSKDKEPQKRKVKIVEEAIAETPDPKPESPKEAKIEKAHQYIFQFRYNNFLKLTEVLYLMFLII